MRIIGVDPGSRATGYGVIDDDRGGLRHVSHGVIKPPRVDDLPARLAWIFKELGRVISEVRPEIASVERTFVSVSPKSALILGEARGAAITALSVAKIQVAEYSAREIKLAVTGYGSAEKKIVQQMVQKLLAMETVPPNDAADALAAAICHTQRRSPLVALTKGRSRRPRSRGRGKFVVRG